MDIDTAILTLFPKSLDLWQKFMYNVILYSVVLVTVLNYVDTTNPLFDSIKSVASATLPFSYIAWILTQPMHSHKIALKTVVLALAVNLVSNSVDFSSSPTWVSDGATAASDISLGLLQGGIFATVYTLYTRS